LFSADVQGATKKRRLKARIIESFTAHLRPDYRLCFIEKFFADQAGQGSVHTQAADGRARLVFKALNLLLFSLV
jgi:hypothetical protein